MSGSVTADEAEFTDVAIHISVHPGGRWVAVYGARQHLWEVDVSTRTVRQLHAASADLGTNAHCRHSQDGRILIAWGMSRPPLVWDRETEKQIVPPQLAGADVMDIDFHGETAATALMKSRMEFLALPGFQSVAPSIRDTNWLRRPLQPRGGDLVLTGGRGRIGHVWD